MTYALESLGSNPIQDVNFSTFKYNKIFDCITWREIPKVKHDSFEKVPT